MKDKKSLFTSIDNLERKINLVYYKIIHERLPKSLKKICLEIFLFTKILFLSRLKFLNLSMFYVKGIDKLSNKHLRVVVFGNKMVLRYVCSLFFEKFQTEEIKKIFIWQIKKEIKKINKDADAVFIRTDRFFKKDLKKNGFIVLPEWAEMQLDLNTSLDHIFKRFSSSAKDDVRKIKNIDYHYVWSSSEDSFEDFYHRLYMPYVFNRHKDLAIPESKNYEEIKAIFQKGNLLLVKDKDKIVSGIIIITQGKTVFVEYAGVDVKDNYLSKVAGSALYYFIIKWSKENDFHLIDFGGARPFLEDGLFKYKMKWGMTPNISNKLFGVFGIKICNFKGNPVVKFIENNPLLYIDKDELKALIFVSKKLDRNIVQQIWKKYNIRGISRLTLITTEKVDEKLKTYILSNFKNKISVIENYHLLTRF